MHVNLGDTARMAARQADWPLDVFRHLRGSGVRQVGYVPDAGHKRLIELAAAEPEMHAVCLTTEEEGVALAAGAWLGGERCVLLMQSSGVGNCINMLSLIRVCRFPLLMLVTMRGEWGEFNPWQVPMGSSTEPALNMAGVGTVRADAPDQAGETVRHAAAMAYGGGSAVAVLLSQKLIGAKVFAEGGTAI
jgi:sulfopyruvate decarboxylase alpha subunit